MTSTPEYLTDSAIRLATKAHEEARSLHSEGYAWRISRRLLVTRLLLAAAVRTLSSSEYDPVSRVLDALHDYLLLKAPSSVADGASDNLRLCRILRVLGEFSGVVAIKLVKSADAADPPEDAEHQEPTLGQQIRRTYAASSRLWGPPKDAEHKEPTIEDLIRNISVDVVEAARS